MSSLPYFTFKGVSSTSMGVIVREYPPITKPPERVTSVTVPGRSGELHIEENTYPVYEAYLRTMDCYIRPGADIKAICGWLTGSGALVCGNEPGYQYTARVISQIDLEKILRGKDHRSFLIPFRCEPYKYHLPATAAFSVTKGSTVNNPGNAAALPLLTVTGSGTGQYISMAGRSLTLNLPSTSTTIRVDCEAGEIMNSAGTAFLNQYLVGDFGYLDPGSNVINWSSGITAVTMTPRWRSI